MSSHRTRTAETRGSTPRATSNGSNLPSMTTSRRVYTAENVSSAPKKSNGMSTTTSVRRADGPAESNSRFVQTRPSALPRSTSSSSQARLNHIASARPMPTYAGKSPPLQALSFGLPTTTIPRLDTSDYLRIRGSEQDRYMESLSHMDYEDDTVFGVAVPEKSSTFPIAMLPPQLIPELQALAASTTHMVNPGSSSISSISSPSTCASTQLTTSSSPWSASTTTTTPISWSSASPSGIITTSTSSRRSHTVPVPSNVRSRLPKLPVLKEAQPPAASPKVALTLEEERGGRKLRRTPRASPEPTPPTRSSSLRQTRSRSNSAAKSHVNRPQASDTQIPQVAVSAISSTAPQGLAPDRRAQLPIRQPSQGNSRLQEALSTAPKHDRSYDAVQAKQEPRHEIISEQPQSRELLEPLPIAQNRHRRFPSLSRRHARQPSSSEPEVEKESARSRLAKFSRTVFGRSSKTSIEGDGKQQNLHSRKGPAAGTGHEGYGKFGRRGRKQSIGSSAAATDSETSIASTSRRPVEKRRSRISSTSRDQSDLDDFAASRVKPVVMVGGSQRGRTNPFPTLPRNPQLSDSSLNTMSSSDSYPALMRVASPRRERFPPENEIRHATLATRRSQKFRVSEDSFRMPEPLETSGLIATPALDSRNTTRSSEAPSPANAMYRIDPGLLEKQRSKSKRMKWNIFRRKESISDSEGRPLMERPPTRAGMSVNVAPATATRPVPYYAMLDSEAEVPNTVTIGRYLREAQESPERGDEVIPIGFSDDEVIEYPYARRESVLLPMAPSRQGATPIPATASATHFVGTRPEPQMAAPEPVLAPAPVHRQPRLAQVGRIPKVIPTKQQSIPGVSAPQETSVPPQELPKTSKPKLSREQLPRLTTRPPPVTKPFISNNRIAFDALELSSTKQPLVQTEPEFLRYSETRNSDFTTSSDSTGIISIMGPPFSYPASAAERRSQFSHEDDVWNEYDDFMDDIMSPSQTTKSPTQQKRSERSFRIENKSIPTVKEPTRAKGLAILPTPPPPPAAGTVLGRQYLDPLLMPFSSVPSLHEMASSEEVRLRRSRIAAALHNSYAPSSPFSMRDFLDEYGRPLSSRYSERLSGSSAPSSEPKLAIPQPYRERSQPRQYENAEHLEAVERTKNPTKHSDRQYASLMVSRWLSFGRVLFSPANQIIETEPQKHVLVIDGLGSQDWSIYCAVTYQAQEVFVHDLKERRTGKGRPKATQMSDGAPANHRKSEVSSFNDKFPFPPGFFTAIVIRFPPAMPDSKLKNIISECRRVLAAGGYLELMVLDLDVVNMGVQTRRAIKELKIKMSAADRAVSLKPIIDNVQTVLGSNGFSNLSRCVVGVPVVGKPAGSLDSSSESRSSTGSVAPHRRRSSAGPRPYGSLGGEANFSLNDLVDDHSENADAKIGRMVSRTARSWWQHCFEAGAITESSTSKSILANKEILNECKTRAANFKLLIAYTQKPLLQVEQKRRTMSEPTVSTLATAGSSRPTR